MSPDLEELCTFVKQYFPNGLCMTLQNCEWVKKKIPFEVKDQWIVTLTQYQSSLT